MDKQHEEGFKACFSNFRELHKERLQKEQEKEQEDRDQMRIGLMKILAEGKKRDVEANRSKEESDGRQQRRAQHYLLHEILNGDKVPRVPVPEFDSSAHNTDDTDSTDSGVIRANCYEFEVPGEGIYVEPLNIAFPNAKRKEAKMEHKIQKKSQKAKAKAGASSKGKAKANVKGRQVYSISSDSSESVDKDEVSSTPRPSGYNLRSNRQ